MENQENYVQAVRSAMEKTGAFSGGFDIMERLVKKQKKSMPVRKKSIFTPIIQAKKSIKN